MPGAGIYSMTTILMPYDTGQTVLGCDVSRCLCGQMYQKYRDYFSINISKNSKMTCTSCFIVSDIWCYFKRTRKKREDANMSKLIGL